MKTVNGTREERATATVPALDPNSNYSSRLSARSALFTDLQLLLDDRPSALTSDAYRKLVIEENCLSRSSTAARNKIWTELRKRYPLDARSPLFAAFWQEWRRCMSEPERLLTMYVLFAVNDRLVTDLATIWLCSYLRRSPAELRLADLRSFIARLGETDHPEVGEWTESTRHKIAKHFLASARDAGLARGKVAKTSIRPALYGAPIRLIVRVLRLTRANDLDVVRAQLFRLLALEGADVIHALAELNQRGELRFRMQADVIELDVEERG